MKPFIVIDRFILNRVEKLSHCLQKTFGLGCQLTANLVYGGFIVRFISIDIVNALIQKHYSFAATLGCGILPIYLLVYFVANPFIGKINNELNARGIANFSKINPRSIRMRLIGLLMSGFFYAVGLVIPTYWGTNMLLVTLSEYFQACDDLPPGKSRVRKFVDAIKAFGMKPVGVEQ